MLIENGLVELRMYPVKFAGHIVRCLPAMFRSTGALPEARLPQAPCILMLAILLSYVLIPPTVTTVILFSDIFIHTILFPAPG